MVSLHKNMRVRKAEPVKNLQLKPIRQRINLQVWNWIEIDARPMPGRCRGHQIMQYSGKLLGFFAVIADNQRNTLLLFFTK